MADLTSPFFTDGRHPVDVGQKGSVLPRQWRQAPLASRSGSPWTRWTFGARGARNRPRPGNERTDPEARFACLITEIPPLLFYVLISGGELTRMAVRRLCGYT